MTKNRLTAWIGPLLGVILFSAAILVLYRELAVHHLRDISNNIRFLSTRRIAAALLLTAGGYGVMTTYDLLAVHYVKQALSFGKLAMAAFVGAAFSNNIGLSMIAGASIRYRLYASWGLSALEITKVVFFCTLTVWLGFFFLGGTAFILDPLVLPPAVHLPQASTRAIGILMVMCIIGYLAVAKLHRQPVQLGSWQFDIPSWRTGALQVFAGALDWLLAGCTLIVLLPSGAGSLLTLLVIYLMSQMAGLISQVPGGIGVFETVFLLMTSGRIPADTVIGALLAYRVIYYLIPLAVSAAVLGVNEGFLRRDSLKKVVAGYRRWSAPVVPPVLAFTTFVAGAVLLFSGATPAIDYRLVWLRQMVPLPLLEASHFVGSSAGMGLMLLARGLQRRLDGAYWVTMVLLAAGITASLLKGLDYEEALLLALLLGALLPSHRFFYRRASLLNQPFAPAWIAAIAIVMISALWLGLFSYKHVEYNESLWWQFAFNAAAPRFLRATAGAAIVLLTFALAHLMRPAVHHPSAPTPAEMVMVKQVVSESPFATANLALLGDKAFLFNASQTAFIMYAVEGRSWISMGDPVGSEDQWPELIWRFREQSDRFGGWTIFYQIGPDHLTHYLDLGLSLTKLGETARVPLADFTLNGGHRKGLRYIQRKMLKEGLAMKVLAADAAAGQLDRLKQISDAWLAEKNTREKSFSMGSFDADYLRHFDLAVVEKAGVPIAFANLWKGAGKAELSIDLMRYDSVAAPSGVMDFLFIELMNWGRDQGYQWFDLGMAPLSGIENRSPTPLWNRLAVFVAHHGGHFYNFQGLRQYKDKFDPVWEPRYLASPGGLILPAILTDLIQLISGSLKGALLK